MRLQEIRETDRSIKSRLSSGSAASRSDGTLNGNAMKSYRKNHHNHNVF